MYIVCRSQQYDDGDDLHRIRCADHIANFDKRSCI